jgi:hypothetical protein
MKTNDSSRRVASKRLVLATETVKSLGVRTGVQTGLVVGIGVGPSNGQRPGVSIGFCQPV